MSAPAHVVRVRPDGHGGYVATLWQRVHGTGYYETNVLHRFVREAYAEDRGRAVLLAAGDVTEHDVEVA